MAFTTIAPSQTDADSPLDQSLMDTIRENLDDLDAARVTNGDAHDHAGGDGGLLSDSAHIAITAGSTYLFDWIGVVNATENNTSYSRLAEPDNFRRMVIPRDGTYTVDFDLSDSGGGSIAYGKIYKNGAAFGTEQTRNVGTYQTKSEPLTLSEGDYLDLYLKTNNGTYPALAKNFKLSAAIKHLG